MYFVSDPFSELEEAKKKIEELKNLCASQDVEVRFSGKQFSN